MLQVVVTPVTGAMLTNRCNWSSPMGGTTWSASTTPVQTAIVGPKMVVGRNDHTSTLLPDGRVLIAGGSFIEGISSAEVYDAEANTLVSLPAAPPKASNGHYFSLANGDLLITGGTTSGTFNFGVEIFNPRTGEFKAAPSLATTRSHHSVVQLADGRFLLTGGADLDGIMSGDSRSTEIYVLRMDFDRDGMDDDWELAHGFDPARREDAVEDADGEGHSNLQEFLAGTDPRDPLNVLRIETPRKVGNSVQIRFPTVLGKYYRVERSSAPNAASWDVVAGNVAGDGHVAEILDPINSESPSSIYRVVLLP